MANWPDPKLPVSCGGGWMLKALDCCGVVNAKLRSFCSFLLQPSRPLPSQPEVPFRAPTPLCIFPTLERTPAVRSVLREWCVTGGSW